MFALNETCFISDKRAIETIDDFAIRPAEYAARVKHILGHPGQMSDELVETVEALSALFRAVVELAQGLYQPRYAL